VRAYCTRIDVPRNIEIMEKRTAARIGGLTWKEIMYAIETRPTVQVWPVAGPALGFMSKSAAYAAARNGHIRVLEQGRKRPVPTPWLRHVLGLDARRRSRPRKAG
jgi:hypothetical protein